MSARSESHEILATIETLRLRRTKHGDRRLYLSIIAIVADEKWRLLAFSAATITRLKDLSPGDRITVWGKFGEGKIVRGEELPMMIVMGITRVVRGNLFAGRAHG